MVRVVAPGKAHTAPVIPCIPGQGMQRVGTRHDTNVTATRYDCLSPATGHTHRYYTAICRHPGEHQHTWDAVVLSGDATLEQEMRRLLMASYRTHKQTASDFTANYAFKLLFTLLRQCFSSGPWGTPGALCFCSLPDIPCFCSQKHWNVWGSPRTGLTNTALRN